ncbi:MAG TPA: diaminopimelate epimerase [Bacteroidia bacterium]|nr:diaminopimelate epimerase [Bacteroidia bacterium]
MKIQFYKYEGTGNDFVIIDNRKGKLKANNPKLWEKLCDRRFGIGADGLMLLQNKKGYDFEMVYVNSDGKPSSMCGNGGRCITHFAKMMDVIKGNKVHFLAIDGDHDATIKGEVVKLKMKDVTKIEEKHGRFVLNTGSPHYVEFVKNAKHTDVVSDGRTIRNSATFKKEGINVNFVEIRKNDMPLLRTYERGVEDETLSCGTGTVATALVLAEEGKATAKDHCDIQTMGGKLKVWFKKNKNSFNDVWLEGPVKMVFEGEIEIK